MKIRCVGMMLLIATVLCCFGCTVAPVDGGTDGTSYENNAIFSQSAHLSGEETNMLNVASVDVDGQPLFQIVYDIAASRAVREACQSISKDVYHTTGVEIPVVHSMGAQRKYEILVGNVARAETVDIVDGFDLGENDFAICVVNTRVLIYAKNERALLSGIGFFTARAVHKSASQKLYGVEQEYCFTYTPYAIPRISILERTDDRFVEFSMENGAQMYTYVRLSYTGTSGWRLQTKICAEDTYRDNGAAQMLAYAMGEYELDTEDARFYTEKIASERTGDVYTVTGPDKSRVEIDLASFKMDFYTPSNRLASTVTNISYHAGGSTLSGVLASNEAIFGTGERFNSVNQRGKKIEMFSKDFWSMENACYMVVPLLCSSRGSGIFINNYEHMMLDLDSQNATDHTREGTWQATVTEAPLDCYIYTTEQITDVIHNYSRLSGYAKMPEEWTYGMLVCAYNPDLSQKWSAEITPSADGRGEGVYEMIANMEAHDLPWTGVIAEAWDPYIDYKHEDLEELCDYVHSLGKKLIVYMRVGNVQHFMSGFDTSYYLTQTDANGMPNHKLPDTTSDTNNPDAGAPGQTHNYIDITNPEAMEWFFGEYWDMLVNDIGVDGCKIDFCESLPENYKLNYYDENVPTAGSHHWYPTAFCAMFYDMISAKPDSGMCYTRGGGIGSQRAPYMWTGDQHRFWEGIQYQLKGLLSAGISGVPYMSHDMSGYQYGNDSLRQNVEYESRVFLRGAQYSAFTVCMQMHGTVKRPYQFAAEFPVTDANGDVVMKDYTYVTEIYRAYSKLHEHLTPYITELCEEASTTGMPIMRHLVLGWQDDPRVYAIDDEYTFGDAFLIAPILDEGTTRSVYLPRGTWKDLNSGETYEVGAQGLTLTVSAGIAELPTFFNVHTESETARELVNGIEVLYGYARGLAPKAEK